MEDPVVFIIPPAASLECALHKGVLIDPVDTPCGCTFCSSCISDYISEHHRCPTHTLALTVDHLRHNEYAQGFISELLIHCKGGVQQTASGTWIPNPAGCKLWINLGTRKEHENICVHVKNPNYSNESSEVQPIRTCAYREAGCLFIGSTLQDMMVHTETCGYGRLLQQVERLELVLAEKDVEIERLLKDAESRTSSPPAQNILDSISRGLDKLDEDSTRLFEDAKDTLRKTRTNILNSSAYQTSLQVLHSIREAVESARNEFVAKIVEFELVAKNKVRLIANSNNLPAHSQNSNLSNLSTSLEDSTSNTTEAEAIDTSNVDTQTNPHSEATDDVEGDEDLKEFLLVSKQENEKQEEETRRNFYYKDICENKSRGGPKRRLYVRP